MPSSTTVMPYSVFMGFIHKSIPQDLGFPVTANHVTGAFWGLVALWTATEFYGADILVTTLAIIYPAYMSYKAEKKGTYPTQWIAYWIIFATVYMLEFLQLVVYYLPVYYTFKMALYLWCMYPAENNGAVLIYNGALKPALVALDNWVNSMKSPIVEFPKED